MDLSSDLTTSANRCDFAEPKLRALLLANGNGHLELPYVSDLATAATSLARGQKRKVLLPLHTSPCEFALVRRGERIAVSIYDTTASPEVHQLNHDIALSDLLLMSGHATVEHAGSMPDATSKQIALRIGERALQTIIDDSVVIDDSVIKRSGPQSAPRDSSSLSFGFEAQIFPGGEVSGKTVRADVHAMLFEGRLWGFLRGRRVELGHGPIMLAVQRMVCAVRSLVDAWESGRPANIRLRTGAFAIGVRLTLREQITLSLQCGRSEIRASELDIPSVALPILRLASDAIRAMLSVDRSQARNLRVSTLREEVRELRRIVRASASDESFVNRDRERIVPSVRESSAPARQDHPAIPGQLRFEQRWRIDIGELDAGATYFCGDRLVVSSPNHTVAVDRNTGDILWAREGAKTAWMAGTSLLRVLPDGELEVCSVSDGETQVIARVVDACPGPKLGVVAGDDGLPPLAILGDTTNALIALDLRTGEPRWRFASGRSAPLVRRAGRLLLIACEGGLHALDLATGEDLWRFSTRGRFARRPAVSGDTVVAVTEGAYASIYGLDLISGEVRFRERLGCGPMSAPILCAGAAILSLSREVMVAIDLETGATRWEAADPGLASGAALAVDDSIIVNVPGGHVVSIDATTGGIAWSHVFGDPDADEVPRSLENVLRGGALFVPSGGVQILRPTDGSPLGRLDTELVPDRIRVDERGWVYIAEESGHLAAFAPAPQLRVLAGGKR